MTPNLCSTKVGTCLPVLFMVPVVPPPPKRDMSGHSDVSWQYFLGTVPHSATYRSDVAVLHENHKVVALHMAQCTVGAMCVIPESAAVPAGTVSGTDCTVQQTNNDTCQRTIYFWASQDSERDSFLSGFLPGLMEHSFHSSEML